MENYHKNSLTYKLENKHLNYTNFVLHATYIPIIIIFNFTKEQNVMK